MAVGGLDGWWLGVGRSGRWVVGKHASWPWGDASGLHGGCCNCRQSPAPGPLGAGGGAEEPCCGWVPHVGKQQQQQQQTAAAAAHPERPWPELLIMLLMPHCQGFPLKAAYPLFTRHARMARPPAPRALARHDLLPSPNCIYLFSKTTEVRPSSPPACPWVPCLGVCLCRGQAYGC